MTQQLQHAMDFNEVSAREVDQNGYVTIKKNPITRAGVFMYSGRALPDADPNKMYAVYRPLEELTRAETLESFKLLPIIDEHEMLGDGYERGAEEKGTHGTTGEEIAVNGFDILAPLRIFSRTLKTLVDSGKRGLSMGYRCVFEKSAGVFEGMPYDYIQKNIFGNHIALVNQGRVGTAVLDHHWAFDHFDLALETEENKMADENKAGGEEKKEMTLTEITAALGSLMPMMEKVNEFMVAASGAKADKEVNNTAALDGDTKLEAGEQAEDADDDEEKKDDEKSKKKEDAMDATEISGLKQRLSAVEKVNTKSIFAEAAARDALVKEVSPVIGTFDHADMTADDVAKYACDKLGLKSAAGAERASLAGYLAGVKANAATVNYALDTAATKPKSGGLLAASLAKTA